MNTVLEDLRVELIVLIAVFTAGMAWGALGQRIFGNPRRGWE